MIDKESETIEYLVSILLTFTSDQMAAFVAGAQEIIAQYTQKNWPRAPTPPAGRTQNRQSALNGALSPFMGLQKWS